MALYTPFFKDATATLGEGMGAKRSGELAQSAYMGDPNALGELFRVNPQLAQQIKQQKLQEEQAKLSTAATNQSMRASEQQMAQSAQQFAAQNREMIQGVYQEAAKLPTHAAAQQYIDQQIQQLKASGVNVPPGITAQAFTPEEYEQIKQLFSPQQPPIKVREGESLVDPTTMQPVYTAPKSPGAGDQRDRRIASLVPQLQAQFGYTPEQAETEAANIADGNIRYDTLESGQVRRVNQVTGEVSEVPITPSGQSIPGPQQGQTLYDLASAGTGLLSGARALLSGTAGQIPGMPIAEETINARTSLENASGDLIRALAVNDRFPVGEIKRIEEQISIKPSVMDSPGALQARMISLGDYLKTRKDQAMRDASDPSVPQSVRDSQAANASAIGNFIARLGAPERVSAATLDSPAAVQQLSKPSLQMFIRGASDAELDALPDDVAEAIEKALK